MIAASPLSLAERRKWTTHFGSHLEERLRWVVGYVQAHRHKPAALKPYGDSLITLVRQAGAYPPLARHVVDTILALHPLPERWGYWTAWEEVLQTGAAVAGRHGWHEQEAELLAHQALLLWSCSRHDEAVPVGRRALQIADAAGAALSLGLAGGALARSLSALGQVEEAGALLAALAKRVARLRRTASRADYAGAMLALEHSQALLLRQQGQQDRALAVARRMLQRVEGRAHISPYQRGDTHVELATMLWAAGDYPAAVEALQTAIDLFEEVEDTVAAVFARGNLGLVYWSMARYDLAEAGMRQCAAFCEQFNIRWRLISEVGNLAVVYLGQGRLEEALHHVERHLELAGRYGHDHELSRARLNRGAIRLYLHDYETARHDLEASLERVTGEGRQELIAAVSIDLSLCWAGLGRLEEARRFAHNAFAMAEAMTFPGLTIIAHRTLAQYGEPAERIGHLQKALSLARQHQRLLDEAACLFSLSGLMEEAHERAAACRQAAQLLKQMGAEAWLRQGSPEAPPLLALML